MHGATLGRCLRCTSPLSRVWKSRWTHERPRLRAPAFRVPCLSRREIVQPLGVAVNIALFITCFNDTLFPETGQAMVQLFDRLGYSVDFPLEQTCCGQMHFNTG